MFSKMAGSPAAKSSANMMFIIASFVQASGDRSVIKAKTPSASSTGK